MPVGPLRDALRVLEAEGILTIHPRAGIEFVKPGLELTRATYQFRSIIEGSAVAVYAETADEGAMVETERRHRAAVDMIEAEGLTQAARDELERLEELLHNAIIASLQQPAHRHQLPPHPQLPAARPARSEADRAAGAPLAPRAHRHHRGLPESQRDRRAGRDSGPFRQRAPAQHGSLLMPAFDA